MHRRLNVCLVAPLPPQFDGRNHSCGGIGHWTQMVLKFAQRRDDVALAVIDTTPRWRSIHNFSLWKRALSGGLNLSGYMVRLLKKLVSGKVDVIHMTTSGDLGVVRDLLVLITSRVFGVPVIYHIRFGRVPILAQTGGFEWALLSTAMRMAATVVAIDAATYSALRQKLPRIAVALVPNCINLDSIQPQGKPKSAERTVLFAGWVIPAKGVEELLGAWARIRKEGWQLAIVGPVDPVYQRDLTERHATEAVLFLGERTHEETLSLIGACDVFVLPSYSEGFPNAVLEAMAQGKAIVASSVGAIPEMLAEGAGELVPSKDVDGLASALQRTMVDEQARLDMGEKARSRVMASYSIEAVFERYMKIWLDVSPGVRHGA